jgi:DNA helicase-2/ATP-dependent DNA helicase PcrA
VINAREEVEDTLDKYFPWCQEWADELRQLFRSFVDAKGRRGVLDYDDLLLYWYYLMQEPALAEQVGEYFDAVLVDEYQDTNALQAEILRALRPSGSGLTVVGDDAQAIYGFRAATVRNILDFPSSFEIPGRVVTLEENYRSTQPILDAANSVIELASEQYAKQLFSSKSSDQRPILATVDDEQTQVDYVIDEILAAREGGVPLRNQAVLFRTSHHSDALEVELGKRNIPYLKYGGLKFLEAAHVKDLVCLLRWAENPRDAIASFRITQLLDGIGPGTAARIADHLEDADFDLESLARFPAPSAARERWLPLCDLVVALQTMDWSDQLRAVRGWYDPVLVERYDSAVVRQGDLDQLEQIGAEYSSRERFLSELTLDPPSGSGDQAGPPHLDEDFLILSTIHSAKGQEWDAVYVLNLADGCIPSDMATGDLDQIEEERRLLYVAMTRARNRLHMVHPLRFFVRQQHRRGDRHVFTPLSRFLPEEIHHHFERVSRRRADIGVDGRVRARARVDVGAKVRGLF